MISKTHSAFMALTYARCGFWNDCWLALADADRRLFERVEGYCGAPITQTCKYQAIAIEVWLKEQGIATDTGN